MNDLGSSVAKVSFDGTTLMGSDVANPCGLIGRYIFNDIFALYQGNSSISIDETNIAHTVDIKYKFKSPPDA
jgi:hypothetical protein